jgi:transcriptional regulator with XRE-family HTH domain
MSKEEALQSLQGLLKNTPENENWRKETLFRKANKAWLIKSARIAVKILLALREKQMTQVQLAEKMAVSPQQINKILKGRENLTLETTSRLEEALGIELITVLKSDEKVVKSQEWNAMLTYYFPCYINLNQPMGVSKSECIAETFEKRA